MPLVGVISDDPNHEGQTFRFDEYIDGLKTGRFRSHFPIQLFVAMGANKEERKDAGVSATTLTGCAREFALAQEHEYYEKPDWYWDRFWGTVVHLGMEHYSPWGPNDPVSEEVRYRKAITVEVDGVELIIYVTGKSDHAHHGEELILDYKSVPLSAVNLPTRPKPYHTEQVNVYAWLLWGGTDMKTGEIVHHRVTKGGIQFLDKRGASKAPVEIWPLEQTEAWIRERVPLIARWQRTGELPPVLPNMRGKRHWKCSFCAVRTICDERATEERRANR